MMSAAPHKPATAAALTITVTCPPNQPPNPYTTTHLNTAGTYDAGGMPNVSIQCWIEYPVGTFYKTLMTRPTGGTTWRATFAVALPATGADYADLTAHLYDSTGTELAVSAAVEVQLAAGGVNNC
jgi:hypothetical protein